MGGDVQPELLIISALRTSQALPTQLPATMPIIIRRLGANELKVLLWGKKLPVLLKQGMMGRAYILSPLEVEAGGFQVLSQRRLYSKTFVSRKQQKAVCSRDGKGGQHNTSVAHEAEDARRQG